MQSFTSVVAGDTLKLNFNHPVKELVWGKLMTSRTWGEKETDAGEFDLFSTTGTECTFQLKLNGHDRFEKQDLTYFTRYQVNKYHTGYGSANQIDAIGVYSFALKPEEHQPSGTCNFSRIDNAQLIYSKARDIAPLYVYAVNYNVLRIMSGMGGLAYSN